MTPRFACHALFAAVVFFHAPARGRADFPGAGEFADAIVANMTPRYEGPRVDEPLPSPRPEGLVPLRAAFRPVTLHVPPAWSAAMGESTLAALETAFARLDAAGWPTTPDDGGRGGTASFDLYVVDGAAPEARTDGRLRPSALDGAMVHAVVDPTLGPQLACVTMAYADAMLLAIDPAEAAEWRRATAAWLAWRVSGRWGCVGDAVAAQQAEPWRSWVGNAAERGAGGALFVALLADGHGDAFPRELWQGARQLTWEGDGLRARPDLFGALDVALARAGHSLDGMVETFAAARWFVGPAARATFPTLRGLDPAASVPLGANVRYRGKSFALPAADPPLEPFGSAYHRVELVARDDATVGVWLRGELGVRWSLVVVRLDAQGRERGRVVAPVRRDPNAFLPVVTDDETAALLVVVTNVSSRLPDPTIPDENVRSFALTVGPVR